MIGFFDSGIGGLTTIAKCIKDGLKCEITYYADYKNAPFGNKSKPELNEISRRAVDYLRTLGADQCVCACNTLSLATDRFDDNVIRLKIPFELVDDYSSCLFLGTEYSVSALPDWYFAMGGKAQALPLLATLIDDNSTDTPNYLKDNLSKKYKTVILGCTHYVFVKSDIKRITEARKILTVNEGVRKKIKKAKTEELVIRLQKEKAEEYSSALSALGVNAVIKRY